MVAWNGLDRRRFPRVLYPCLIVMRKLDEEPEVLLTHTENIGIGGICVVLKKTLKLFSNVELELDLLDAGEHIKCKGKVVWNIRRKNDVKQKPLFYDTGIEFVTINDKERQRIEEVVSRLVKFHLQKF